MSSSGLIDAHIHLSWNGVFESYPIFFGEPLAERLRRNAWLTLKSGVTTVREMPGFGSIKLKCSIEKGEVLGPRLLVSTPALTVPGGYLGYPGWGITIKDAQKIGQVVDEGVKRGYDFIKTVAPYSDALKKQVNIFARYCPGLFRRQRSLTSKSRPIPCGRRDWRQQSMPGYPAWSTARHMWEAYSRMRFLSK